MKKLISLLVALVCGVALNAAVTWNVEVPEGTHECYISGVFNGWTFTQMVKVDDTHYTLTDNTTDTKDGYKYSSGPSWDYAEQTASGSDDVGELSGNRKWAENDVVARWKALYDPTVVITYVDILIRVKSDKAPLIWWWGAGDKCPNPEATQDAQGDYYNWYTNHPVMSPVAGRVGWYEWEFKDVNESFGVTFKLDSVGRDIKALTSSCYSVDGYGLDCETGEHLPSAYCVASNLNDWNTEAAPMVVADGTAICAITLPAETNMFFAVVETASNEAQTWLKNPTSAFTREANTEVLGIYDGTDNNATLATDVAGNYVFVFTIETRSLSITFPEVTALPETSVSTPTAKIICDGQVLILRDGAVYNVIGQQIK